MYVYGYRVNFCFSYFVNICIGFAYVDVALVRYPYLGEVDHQTRYDVHCGLSVPVVLYIMLTKTKKINKTKQGYEKAPFKTRLSNNYYKSVRHLADLPSLLEKEAPHEWLGLDYCVDCGLQEKYCTCVFEPHSGTTGDNNISRMQGMIVHENVKFGDQVDPYLYDVDNTMDPTRSLQDSDDAKLENFFSRPIKIAEQEWATSTSLAFDINPWALYWENPRVANRIANFHLLKCNLRVKVVINGNGFQYGRALVSYLPFAAFDTLSTNAALIRADLVQASQQPHIFLDPTTSQGGEMKLPFFNYYNYISIPDNQWDELGQLFFRSLNDLKHANGATDVVTVSVFAWAEDVDMSVLTSRESSTLSPQSGFEIQSGNEVDEVNRTGTISGPATAIAKASSALTSIPYIAPFASATSIAASATAKIAKMFGYCRPIVTKNPEPYKPHVASALAVTNVGDGPTKMTVDDKQELSIDPRIAGLGGVDPLNIREIAKRESYLTTFSWQIGTTPETLLWNARIDPVIWAENAGSVTSYHFPACAMAALPFKYWTGSMKFRFQIVCSSFHKGRIKIVYDPNWLSSNEYNTNYIKIVDIADETDFTVEIANGQDTTLLTHHLPGLESVTQMYSTTAYTSKEQGNGVVGVYVVNELTTPNSTVNNDIEVNVYVSMGDDFEVFVPDDHFQYFTFGDGETAVSTFDNQDLQYARNAYRPSIHGSFPSTDDITTSGAQKRNCPRKPKFEAQSGVDMGSAVVSESQNTAEPSAPQQTISDNLGVGKSDLGMINQVFTGESITSFRTMLKRYDCWFQLFFGDTSASKVVGRLPAFPFLRGNVAGAIDNTVALVPYNYCNTVLLHWVTYAFSGWRGSIRYKLLPKGSQGFEFPTNFYIQRHPLGETEFQYTVQNVDAAVTTKQAGRNVILTTGSTPNNNSVFSGRKGQVFQNSQVNPGIEFEVPYYSLFRFSPGKEENLTGLSFWNEGWDFRIQTDGQADTLWDVHVAAGEDFQAYFFTGLPRMYYEPSAPN